MGEQDLETNLFLSARLCSLPLSDMISYTNTLSSQLLNSSELLSCSQLLNSSQFLDVDMNILKYFHGPDVEDLEKVIFREWCPAHSTPEAVSARKLTAVVED